MSLRSLACAFFLTAALSTQVLAQAKLPKRCDWHGVLSGGESPYIKCMDIAALNGKTETVPKNVTRISADGLSFCQPATPVTGAGNADIVFVYDNSGSMTADLAYITPTGDTLFYYNAQDEDCRKNNVKNGEITYTTQEGQHTVARIMSNNQCAEFIAGDPYQARARVVKAGIDYLALTSPTSTAGAISFYQITNYERPPMLMSDDANVTTVKNSVKVYDGDGTHYRPPLKLAKQWLTDPARIKTSKQAIVFVSDGAPLDDDYKKEVDASMPPIFSIYLADEDTPNMENLKELSQLTGGTFNRVNTNDPKAMETVLKQIITTITKNTLPKSATITNKTLSPPQTSSSTGVVSNPDGGAAMKLDSIIGLKPGKNEIEIKLTREDNTTSTYAFTVDVAAGEISSTGGKYSCYDMPTLTAIDKATNLAPEIYSPIGNAYQLKLTRSPSELREVIVAGGSTTGDKESIKVGNINLGLGYPTQTGDFSYNGNKANPSLGNNILEVSDQGDLTFVWSHPRDARETVTYALPGRVVPIIDGGPDISIKNPVTHGVVFDSDDIRNLDPVIVTDGKKCIVNCTGTQFFHTSDAIPTWNMNIKSPITYKLKIFDNLGQFVCASKGEVDAAAWAALAKSGDSAAIQLKYMPVSSEGQQLGTGAYLMRAEVSAQGNLVTKNSAGETIVVKNAHREYFKRFGYVRAF